jgi:hypothetical protein
MIDFVKILVGPIAALLDKVIPDKDARELMAHEIAVMVEVQTFELAKAQVEVNRQEAAHKSLFVAGWRPAIGWICGTALAWNFVIQPLLLWAAWVFPEYAPDISTAPKLESDELMTVLLGMLGLGGLRTYEKKHNVAREK